VWFSASGFFADWQLLDPQRQAVDQGLGGRLVRPADDAVESLP
jgi:hypothetical protein